MDRYTAADLRDAYLLGLPHLARLQADFLEACKASDAGLSAREMHRKRKDVPLLAWMEAAAHLQRRKLVRTEWRPLTGTGALQEVVYHAVTT